MNRLNWSEVAPAGAKALYGVRAAVPHLDRCDRLLSRPFKGGKSSGFTRIL